MSTQIFKFNDYKKRQERSILITTKSLFNLKGTCNYYKDSFNSLLAIKRKIPLSRIKAITISSVGTEFVLHVPEEYDYRYSSYDKYLEMAH